MTSPLPDLDDLALLELIARTGSLGRAAEELRTSQPSVSRRLDRLERSTGLELVRRGPRGSLLTPAGRVVVGWAATLLGAAGEFVDSVESLRLHHAVSLRIACSMTIAEHLAPLWLTQLRESSPQTLVSLSVHNSSDVVQAVETGQADLGFVESPVVRPGLRRRRIGWDTLRVVVRPDHPWARRRRPISCAVLAREPLLVRETGSGTRETVQEALARHGLELTPALTLASNAALKSSALVGIGPAVLSEMSLTDELASGRLVPVDVEGLELRRPLTMVWRDGDQLPAAAEGLLAAVAQTRRRGR